PHHRAARPVGRAGRPVPPAGADRLGERGGEPRGGRGPHPARGRPAAGGVRDRHHLAGPRPHPRPGRGGGGPGGDGAGGDRPRPRPGADAVGLQLTGSEEAELLATCFAYGRYLLASASRPGLPPANLQGLWNAKLEAPWSSNYTVNINLEMNHWGAAIAQV